MPCLSRTLTLSLIVSPPPSVRSHTFRFCPHPVLGKRVSTILQHLFPVPKAESTRVITFANEEDFILFRHHTWTKTGTQVELNEVRHSPSCLTALTSNQVGPRFELRLYKIRLGTLDQEEAENEWVIHPYTNTAKKRTFL